MFGHRHRFILPIAAIALLFQLGACTHGSLSIEEAKRVTLSVRSESFVPPPRRSYDIVELLKRPNRADSQLAREFLAEVNSAPPNGMSPGRLAKFYFERGKAAMQLGLLPKGRQDFQHALVLAKTADVPSPDIEFHLGFTEFDFGNYRSAEALVTRSVRASDSISRYAYLVKHYAHVGDMERALQWRREAKQIVSEWAARNPSVRSRTWVRYALSRMEAVILEAQGRFTEAEPYWRTTLEMFTRGSQGRRPMYVLHFKLDLINNLKNQGRLAEAEVEARQAIEEGVAFGAKGTYHNAKACMLLGKILLSQGRFEEARHIIEAAIEMIHASGIPIDTPFIGDARIDLVELMAMEGDYDGAAKQFDMARTCFPTRDYFTARLLFRPSVFGALIMSGRCEVAREWIEASHRVLYSRLGREHLRTSILQALRAMATDGLGDTDAAAEAYAEVLPTLLDAHQTTEGDLQRSWLQRVILEAYLDHLAAGGKMSDEETVRQAFQIAESLRHRTLQQAISARSARAALKDPALKDLSRREQDASRQIAVLEIHLANALSAPADQVDPALVARLSKQLAQLKLARQTLQAEIRQAAPLYSNFTRPRPFSLHESQALLKPDEALLAIYSTGRHTFIWGIPKDGRPRMVVVKAGRGDLALLVDRIRRPLETAPATLGDVPAFDLDAAHRLYRLLLASVSDSLSGAGELLTVTSAPLDRLPIGLLPRSRNRSETSGETLLFEEYRRVDWLIRHIAISRHASVAALATLRQTPVQAHDRRPFIGFGDPVFDPNRPAFAGAPQAGVHIRERGSTLRMRGVRITDEGSLDDDAIQSTRLQDLVPLPDTAEEIASIARALQAPLETTVFLGKRASEARVKQMDLTDRRVIAFATHALVPGDLDGLTQPALALSAPEATGEAEDGLLTMGEIMTLNLDADWVVLSACDTGSGLEAGAEAVSGLGRAFFYAGSRALLVSLWPVETSSARLLTTGIFARQQHDSQLGRAQALQSSIVALIDSPGLVDSGTGRVAASYAHPLFWAPFIVYGEGASEGRPAAQ